MDFFNEIFYHASTIDNLVHKKHSHAGYEIIQPLSGNGHVLIKNNIYQMTSDCVCFINASEIHCTNPSNINNYVRNKIIISHEYLLYLSNDLKLSPIITEFFFNDGGTQRIYNSHICEEIDRLFSKIAEISTANNFYSFALLHSYFVQLLILLYVNRPIKPPAKNQLITSIIDYINEHLREELSIDGICGALHISKYYACHLFKKITDMTIMQYILQRRLSAAKILLHSTDLPVSEIAMQLGFSSFSVFSRTFKEYEQKTPTQYRNSLANKQYI